MLKDLRMKFTEKRHKHKLSLRKVGKMTGVSASSLGRFERGTSDHTVDVVERINNWVKNVDIFKGKAVAPTRCKKCNRVMSRAARSKGRGVLICKTCSKEKEVYDGNTVKTVGVETLPELDIKIDVTINGTHITGHRTMVNMPVPTILLESTLRGILLEMANHRSLDTGDIRATLIQKIKTVDPV